VGKKGGTGETWQGGIQQIVWEQSPVGLREKEKGPRGGDRGREKKDKNTPARH